MRYWAPVCIWMASISYFSSHSDPLGFLPSSGHGNDIGNLAHIGEYAGLAALLHRALSSGRGVDREKGGGEAEERRDTSAPLHRRRRLEVVFALALAYAVLDELHQELVPGRGFELADIGYDLAGIITALLLIWLRETK
ncbi:MAG: VanZ family protein [Anaerolineae bacterium]